jgi:NAD(P)-dependent dehydrogenase (short-subunit alcohol dehydrogenase family)
MSSRARFEGKTAIVTGGGLGIGAAITRQLAEEGATVVVLGRRPPAEVDVNVDGERVTYVQGDVTAGASRSRCIEAALAISGQLDVLVNNAGASPEAYLVDTDLDEVRATFELNFYGPLALLVAASEVMPPGSSIVNVTSRLASVVIPTLGAYGAAKAALLCVTKYAAVELAPRGIRVNAVAPGLTETPAMARSLTGASEDERAAEVGSLTARTPQRRVGQPEEVAAAVLFLASSESSHVTGASIPVDGGYTVT